MSIKGISEVRRLPRGGKIRLGIKKTNSKGITYPAEVSYFILDPSTPDQIRRKKLIDEFHELYGPEPTAIKIMLPPVPREMFFAQWLKRYGKSSLLKCRGDNDTAETLPEFSEDLEKIGETERGFIKVRCLGDECIYTKSGECGRMAALQVILYELSGISVWQVDTGSYNSIVNMNSAIDYLQALTGRYAMLPITLIRRPQEISHEGKKSKHYILDIDLEHVSIGNLQKFAMITPVERSLIPAPDESKDDLFYDQNGQKPDKQDEEEQKDAIRGPTSGDLPAPTTISEGGVNVAQAKPEPIKPPIVDKGLKKPGPISEAYEKEQQSRAQMKDIMAGIKTCKTRETVTGYCSKLKSEGYFDGLTEDQVKELREQTAAYMKTLKT